MQYIAIKEEEQNGEKVYIVNAIPLKNVNKAIVQKIPHPLGSDSLVFDNLEAAKDTILRAGFAYVLPNGQKGVTSSKKSITPNGNVDYEQIILSTIKSKINSANVNVVSAAITALSEFPTQETFDILFSKLGDDNELIRKNAIAGICRYGTLLQKRIIETLKSPDWVSRNSAINCIKNLLEYGNAEVETFIIPLTTACDDNNTIVQASALNVLAQAYREYKKDK